MEDITIQPCTLGKEKKDLTKLFSNYFYIFRMRMFTSWVKIHVNESLCVVDQIKDFEKTMADLKTKRKKEGVHEEL